MAESIERFPVSEKGFTFPINEVLTGRGFVTGKSGSGKSNTASVVAEELLDRGLGLMIIDTDGEYSALKERYELLQVGGDDQCDREITAEDAPLIADLALEENVPIILDVSGYMDEEVADDVIHAVVRELFVAEKQHQKPFLLFVEEAHEFIPERGGGDDIHKMLVRVAKRGRKRGLGIVAMSQRPAAVAKDYITQCDWLVWHRLTWENDTKVAGRILGGDAAESVQSLDDGEALVMTDWDEKISRVQFRRKKTIDQGSTPTLREAYGPPGAREDHVTHVKDEVAEGDDEGADGASADADGSEDAGDASTEEATGTSDGEPPDPDTATAEEPSAPAEESTAASGAPRDRASNWDLSDVDIEPRQPAIGTRPDNAGTASPPVDGRPAGAAASAAEPDAGSGDGGRVADGVESAAGTASGERRVRSERRAPLDEPDEYDPVWEIAQLIVYCYGTVVRAHRRAHRRVSGFLLARFSGLRERAVGPRRHDGPGRVDRALAALLSLSMIVGAYALVFGALALLAAG